ncbi:MAG: hypothetical protein HDR21_04115 [Lachnospiraceae bacterium]|nr:hypothetical protein [Lachnospiraceae bacterium]
MGFDKKEILLKQLPAAVIVKNFIKGHSADNEEYLRDFINLSKMVSEKGNERFVLRKHCEQSDGQSDIYNSNYDLDFKILIDPKYMEGQNLLSRSITQIAPGVTAYGNSKVNGKQQACFINWCFRDKSLADLIKIQQNGSSLPEEKVIIHILEEMSIDKHILFFLPFNFFFQGIETDDEVAKFLIKWINDDLRGLIEYRKEKVNKDTYISFISNQFFVISKEQEKELRLYDRINANQSELYKYLMNVGKEF